MNSQTMKYYWINLLFPVKKQSDEKVHVFIYQQFFPGKVRKKKNQVDHHIQRKQHRHYGKVKIDAAQEKSLPRNMGVSGPVESNFEFNPI